MLLQSRLQKRLKALDLHDYKSYCDLVLTKKDKSEVEKLIVSVSTNKTSFFREPQHFDYLLSNILPNAHQQGKKQNFFKLWCAGCSSGEEPYSLSMVMHQFTKTHPGFTFHIDASDISIEVLRKAGKGIYSHDSLEDIPPIFRKAYLLKSKDKTNKKIRMSKALRDSIQFLWINLMNDSFGFDDKHDVIFCRNTLIYFDRTTQERVINNLFRQLKTGGYLILGHSESLINMSISAKHCSPSVYQKI